VVLIVTRPSAQRSGTVRAAGSGVAAAPRRRRM